MAITMGGHNSGTVTCVKTCLLLHQCTDRTKPLGQKPAPSRVLELYTGPAFGQVVWRNLYVNAGSNHPPKVLKNIALGVQRRLSTNSSNEEIFNKAKPLYQDALRKTGHTHELKYEKIDVTTLNKKRNKRQRYKRIFYFTPPYEMTVASPLGKNFIELVKQEFPPDHPYHSVLNEHTVKFSYSVLPNLKRKIAHHNTKITKKEGCHYHRHMYLSQHQPGHVMTVLRTVEG